MTGSRIRLFLASLLVGLAGLSGCSQSPSDITDAAAQQLQESVDSIVQAVVQGRFDSATAELARTRALLDEAADAGHLTVARYRTIDDALRRTETELAAVIAAQAPSAADQEALVADQSGATSGGGSAGGGGAGNTGGNTGAPDHSNAGGKKSG